MPDRTEQSVHFVSPTNLRKMLCEALGDRFDSNNRMYVPTFAAEDIVFHNVNHRPWEARLPGEVPDHVIDKEIIRGSASLDDLDETFRFELAYGTQKDRKAVFDEFELTLDPVTNAPPVDRGSRWTDKSGPNFTVDEIWVDEDGVAHARIIMGDRISKSVEVADIQRRAEAMEIYRAA